MTTSSVHRSFAITLAIAFIIVGPGVSGFAINRTSSITTTLSTEVSSIKSIPLQVTDDLKRLDDFIIENDNSNRTTNQSTVSDDVTEKVSETLEVETEMSSNITQMPITYQNISEMLEVETGKSSNITQIPVTIRTTTEFMRIPTISSDTVEVFDSTEDKEKLSSYSKESPFTKGLELNKTENSTESQQTTTNITSFDKTEPPFELVTFILHVGNESVQLEEKLTNETVARSVIDNKKTTQSYDMPVIPITIETATEILPKILEETKLNRTELSYVGTDLPQMVSHFSNTSAKINDDAVMTGLASIFNSDIIQTTEDVNTNITGKSEINQEYTGIIRKQTTIPEATAATSTKEVNEMKAESSNTRVNFEKVNGVTPMPSLEQLRTDLLSTTNKLFISSELSQRTKKVSREVELTTPYAIKSTEPKMIEKIETKRAGYIDNSEKMTTPVITYASEDIKEKVTEAYGTANNNVTMVTKSSSHNTVSSPESQSRLADDELLEEFLKEEALNNHKENAIRYRVEQTAKLLNLENSDVPTSTSTADSLSVRPIERTKTTLYTVSPNYKPMKKIDVQPAKPFIRDPDDNSWRNESISSLGIVFKPKNSSKSFKEVLKNKTQSELNSLVERTKDEVPDLRVRLEKIAEVRKTKKKKMNNDGEIVYTDYGENSAEMNTKPPELNSTILNSAEVAKMFTPSNSQPELANKIEQDVTTPMTTVSILEESKEKQTDKLDIFSKLGLDLLTTQKPKKFFNMAEYYDSTDEYDADYVTMSKLDLKKFTMPHRSTPSTPLFTKPIVTYIPERRPTVQYFPPRELSVNVNNVDRDFERKINMFTFKEHPRVEARPPFVTVPPLTIATTKPELRPILPIQSPNARPDVIRPTVKPTDLIYPPEISKNYYITNPLSTTESSTSEAFLINSGRVDRGSYVIKHYKDFLNAAVDDVERNADFLPFHTTQPPQETFPTEVDKQTFRPRDDEEDYDTRFRKEVLTRFVENFNQNSERFKVDFPILYNNSIVHRDGEESPASSRTFLKRLYNEGVATTAHGLAKKPCEPNCELTVELAPAYELHYYVPNQEEKEEQPRSSLPPYRHRL